MQLKATYPTPEHQTAAEPIVDHFVANYKIDAVLLVNSCARDKATRDSCLNITVLTKPDASRSPLNVMEADWEKFEKANPDIKALYQVGKYSVVHPNFIHGVFVPYEQDEVAGPDDFEVGVGNLLAYSVPLWEGSDYLDQLKTQWLPYYNEELRTQKLNKVRWFCLNNLHHIPLYVDRGLYFQSFDRLYNAYREFLQALFITRRTYPIAYDKWIREQVEEILGLPGLYEQLSHLFEIKKFESPELVDKAREVEQLLNYYAPSPSTLSDPKPDRK